MQNEFENLRAAEEAYELARANLDEARQVLHGKTVKVYSVNVHFGSNELEVEERTLKVVHLEVEVKDLKVYHGGGVSIAYAKPNAKGCLFLSAEAALKGYAMFIASKVPEAERVVQDYKKRLVDIDRLLAELPTVAYES